jgi:hypothetical protein
MHCKPKRLRNITAVVELPPEVLFPLTVELTADKLLPLVEFPAAATL